MMSEDGSQTANLSPAKQALVEGLRQRAKSCFFSVPKI